MTVYMFANSSGPGRVTKAHEGQVVGLTGDGKTVSTTRGTMPAGMVTAVDGDYVHITMQLSVQLQYIPITISFDEAPMTPMTREEFFREQVACLEKSLKVADDALRLELQGEHGPADRAYDKMKGELPSLGSAPPAHTPYPKINGVRADLDDIKATLKLIDSGVIENKDMCPRLPKGMTIAQARALFPTALTTESLAKVVKEMQSICIDDSFKATKYFSPIIGGGGIGSLGYSTNGYMCPTCCEGRACLMHDPALAGPDQLALKLKHARDNCGSCSKHARDNCGSYSSLHFCTSHMNLYKWDGTIDLEATSNYATTGRATSNARPAVITQQLLSGQK